MSKLKICLVGGTFKGEDEEARSIGLLVEAGKKLDVEMTNIPKGKLIASVVNQEFKVWSREVKVEDQDAFMFRMITNFIDPITKEKTRVYPEIVLIAKHLHNKLNKPIFDEFLLKPNPIYTKIVQAYELIEAGLPYIPTYIYMRRDEVLKDAETLPYPLFLKPANGAQGRGTYKFENPDQLKTFLKEEYKSAIFFPNMLQKAIENDGDYRVVVLNGKVLVTLKKHRAEGSIVANMSQGSAAEAIEADEEIESMAIKAAGVLGMEFAGVDIIEDNVTGKRYVLEVNLSPQIRYSTMYSNFDIATEVMKHVVDKIKK